MCLTSAKDRRPDVKTATSYHLLTTPRKTSRCGRFHAYMHDGRLSEGALPLISSLRSGRKAPAAPPPPPPLRLFAGAMR